MTPPEPTRRRDVAAATGPISASGDAPATFPPPWCSATQ